MTQTEKRIYLIKSLLSEQPQYADIAIPASEQEQKNLLRSLFNLRMPSPVSKTFLQIQDAYLQEEVLQKGITEFTGLHPVQGQIYLWQGDITTLRCDAIVNAANSALLGCFVPCHGCIDNAIHSAAGVQLRLECARIMERASSTETNRSGGRKMELEPAGKAKITKAYNLPCRYVLHTVGPIIHGSVTQQDCDLLAGCYRSCLELATAYQLKNIAFCCISTGEFHFPNKEAAEIAVRTVQDYQKKHQNGLEVIFNVFKDKDYEIYRQLLG